MSHVIHHVGYTQIGPTTAAIRLPGTETPSAALQHAVVPNENTSRCGLPIVHRTHELFEQASIGRCHDCLRAVMSDDTP